MPKNACYIYTLLIAFLHLSRGKIDFFHNLSDFYERVTLNWFYCTTADIHAPSYCLLVIKHDIMDKTSRSGTASYPAEQVTIIRRSQTITSCCSPTKNDQNSRRRIERYLVEKRNHCSSTPPFVSEPIRCPSPPPADADEHINMTIEESTECYNERTWNMYYRIIRHGSRSRNVEDIKSSWYSASFVSCTKNTAFEKARRFGGAPEPPLRNDKSGPDEIFHLEL